MMIPFLSGCRRGIRAGHQGRTRALRPDRRVYRRVADHPTVQGAAGVARAKAGEAVQVGVSKARERVSGPHQPAAPGRAATNGDTPPNPRQRATIVER